MARKKPRRAATDERPAVAYSSNAQAPDAQTPDAIAGPLPAPPRRNPLFLGLASLLLVAWLLFLIAMAVWG